jgi:hypothetical protein
LTDGLRELGGQIVAKTQEELDEMVRSVSQGSFPHPVVVHGEAPVPIPRTRVTYAEIPTATLVVELVRLSSAPSELFYELGKRAERGDFAGSGATSADGEATS